MWDDTTKQKALELIASGVSITATSEQLKVPYSTVRVWTVEPTEHKYQQDFPELRERAITLRMSGMGHTRIANELKVGDARVKQWLGDAEKHGAKFPHVARGAAAQIRYRRDLSELRKQSAMPRKPTQPVADTPPSVQTSLVLAEGNTVSERLNAARSRVGAPAVPNGKTTVVDADYEIARLRGRIDALKIERDALRAVIDKMHGADDD